MGIGTFDLHAILCSSLKLPADTSDLSSSPIWHFRSTGPFHRMRKMNCFEVWRSYGSPVLARPPENSFASCIPQRFLLGLRFNDYLTISRTLVPWNQSTTLGEGPGLRNRLTWSKTSSRRIPMLACLTRRSSNIGLRRFEDRSSVLILLSRDHRVHSEEPFDPVDLFLCFPSLLLVGCSGFRDPVFLNRSSSC